MASFSYRVATARASVSAPIVHSMALRTGPAVSCRSNSLLTSRIHFRGS